MVLDMKVHTIGGVVGLGTPLLDIVPESSELVVEAHVAINDIDRISIGKLTDVHFSAFNSATTPVIEGIVTRISADRLKDEAGEPYYLVRAKLTEKGLKRRATQKSLDRVSAMYDKKMAVVTDLLDLKARVDLLAAQEVDARNQIRLSRAGLSEIVGRPINEPLSRIRNDIALQAPAKSMDTWVAQAIDSNPLLKARESSLDVANAAVREGKGGHYPTLTFTLGAQQSDVGYDNTLSPRSDSYVATIGVRVPIYSGGSTSARVRGLYNEQLATEQDVESVRRQVVKETTNAYLTAFSSVEKIRANKNALASAEQSSIAAQKAFSYGVVNAVDVLTSVQNEFKARRDLLKAQYDFITNLFILNRWAGRPPQESVDSVNVWLGGANPAVEKAAESVLKNKP
ncbi:outer membrane channel protein TolC [Pseudomonas syringae group genomosp. 3]|uniref:Outer membrane channel protein TolC n=3 Tax=Pseudomonas syringae group TaxID=136849 RepID=A0A3M2WYX4_PSEA0|nr:outer membrane channel protein TolC [Pseudomonas amygdali pv. morsprunorum str. M302280]RML56712.1 Outer membrane channel protein TolC [Pseudomonas amygdali pv. morsprunorum]SOS32426.1 outer membrane channel protein TolC [Pseudomonas syringae group genomosp. 3]SPF11407.1 outer membrane channel protein TolC [Pseudomonas syringae group genomosp. 3]